MSDAICSLLPNAQKASLSRVNGQVEGYLNLIRLLSGIPFSMVKKGDTNEGKRMAREISEKLPSLILAMLFKESAGKCAAQSGYGAWGLMQITSETYNWMREKIIKDKKIPLAIRKWILRRGPKNSFTNILIAAYYFSFLCMRAHYRFKINNPDQAIRIALAGYNQGWIGPKSVLPSGCLNQAYIKASVFDYIKRVLFWQEKLQNRMKPFTSNKLSFAFIANRFYQMDQITGSTKRLCDIMKNLFDSCYRSLVQR